ncbi:MAG: GHMP kinase [Clostridia bacterium]|nr:GHMP kinase [Clostridia bacterium]
MNKEFIDLFVPGRLCIMGEHSDWAGKYRNVNNKIEKGYAIVTGIEEGIYAKASIDDKLIVENLQTGDSFECEMDYDKLKAVAEEGGYWSYVAGVACSAISQYTIGGVKITITESSLPEKKGLSSSAAICVLIARAFNRLYNVHLNTMGEMNLAYQGEIVTPSRCGKLDQACAYGKKPVLMVFDGDNIDIKNIKVQDPLYFVFADLKAKKDTIKILGNLNRSYPFAENELDYSVQKGLGVNNKDIVLKATSFIENGQVKELGQMMNEAQYNFDNNVAIACPEELYSPVLHKVLNDKTIIDLSYGRKGVGSQGDGSVQILAKDEKTQKEIKDYLENDLKMKAYELTIEPTRPIKKAIIPVAGNGTRMYPISRCLKKAFLPIIDKDGIIKPSILVLLEELDDAGIEEICLIIDEEDRVDYKKFFEDKLSQEVISKLSPEMLEYDANIQRIGKKLKYIVQKEKLGLGHAISLCEDFAGGEPVLMSLGDQLYKSNSSMSCTEQFLQNYAKFNKLAISVSEVDLNDVQRYGILNGKINKDNDYFIVDNFIEKPESTIAKEKYYTMVKDEKKYFAVFGEYILTEDVFKELKKNIKENKRERGEFQITSAIEEVRRKKGMIAFIPNGKFLDIGNVEAYKNTFVEKAKE